jgi:hypothetical protein
MEVREEQLVHLKRLAEALTKNGLSTDLVDRGPKPYLDVAQANTPALNVQVECRQAGSGSWSFWWKPSQRSIGSVNDLALVVSRIAIVIRPVEAGE